MSESTRPSLNKEARAIRKMFALIANRYDFLNTLFTAGFDAYWRRQAATAAGGARARLILDLCTGTGKLAAELRRQFPQAQVIGVDFCPEMLALAQRKNIPSIRLACGDALALPLKASSCDVVTVAFGIRNFADLRAGLREIYRCLRPGGSAVFLEFYPPQRTFLAAIYGVVYLGRIIPFVGARISRSPGAYAYLRDSVTSFLAPDQLSQMMKEVGFSKVSHRPLSGGIVAIYRGGKEG